MDRVFRAAAALLALVSFFPLSATAQNAYDVYVDTDGSASGCTVTLPGGTFTGADRRLQVTATSGAAPQVTSVTLAQCAGGTFGATVPVSGNYPVGINNGVAGSDVIELSAAVASVFQGSTSARFGFAAVGANGSDVLFTINGTPNGGPIGTSVVYSIPMLGLGGLLLLGLALLVVAKRAGRHRLTVRLLAVGLLLTSGIAIAANFVVDGQVGDWAGEAADANDPAGDASNGAANLDLRAAFVATENGFAFFRIDVADLQNQAPVATPQAVATNEDAAVTITLASIDPENDPRTYAIVTPPSNGTLGAVTQVPPAGATVQYTPNADFNGTDTFTFRATDAQGAASAPATVTITVNPVNDRPGLIATNPPAVNEDAGAQSLAAWATFVAGPANESGQAVLAYTVSNVSNAALFSAAPSVAANGTLTYTPAANANGTSTFDVVVQDNGGTANGGIDTSLPQTFTITVTAANDAPVLTAGATLAYVENGAAAAVDNTITVADVDDTNLESASVQVTAGYQNGADVLSCGACGGITASFAAGTGTLTLTGTATLAAYQAALRTVTYVNTSDAPTAGARTITWIGNDGTVGSTPVTSTVNVAAVNDAPVNTVPAAAQQAIAGGTLTFSAANGNAISIADADAGTANVQSTVSVAPGNGTFVPAAGSGATITGSGTNSLGITGTLTQVNAALNGLVYTAPNATVVATLTLLTSDLGNTPAPAQTDTDTVTINVDAAPSVTTVTPPNGATGVATNTSLTVNFSENVAVTAGGITLTCGAGNLVTGGLPATNTNAVTVTTAGIPAGTLCTGTVLAANVTDSDPVDPPNNLAADFTWTFTTDAAPSVTAVTPANGATGVPTNTSLTVSFDESVTVAAGGITLTCGAGNLVTTGLPATGTSATVNTAGVPAGTLCTGTVVAANVSDTDAGDPPNNMAANVTWTFTTDAAPAVANVTPPNGATNVATNTSLNVVFTENVDVAAGGITLTCGAGNLVTGGLPATNTSSVTVTTTGVPEGTLCTGTVVAANVADSDTNDPPNNMAADFTWQFTTDAAPTVTVVTPANATTALVGTDVTVTFSEPVTVAASPTWFTISCSLSGVRDTSNSAVSGGPTTFTINPNTDFTPGETCNGTIVAAQVSDNDAGDPPNNMAANFTWSFATDAPPAVTATTPANGATGVATNTSLTIDFSESVTVAAGGITLTCGAGNLVSGGLPATGTNVVVTTAGIPAGATCTGTVVAANVTDTDTNDPPNNMAANFTWTFTTDAAPAVTTVSPPNGATNVATNTSLTVNFSESVTVAAGAITLDCGGGNIVTGGLPATGTSVVVTTSGAPAGATCNGTVLAASVSDTDLGDPPNNLAANFTWSFTTDAAPAVTTVSPLNGATQVATNTSITVSFSENVDVATGGITLDCAGPITLTGLPTTGTSSVTLTTPGLPAGTTCTGTVVAANVADTDTNDPPNNLAANFTWTFTTDAAPSVQSTTPGNGATLQAATGNITIVFSESVNFDTTANAANTSFDLECPSGTPAGFTVLTASPATSVVLNPVDADIAGRTCTLVVRAAGIADADAGDPPNNMVADVTATIGFAGIATDDAYAVTPHLTLAIGAASPQGGGVLVNDILGTESITGFGFSPACTGTTPGSQLDAGAANGRLTLNLNGSFSYEPPAGIANATRTFCYTITGGDTANVVFTLANVEPVWFIDATAGAGGIGTQARPFQQFGGAAGTFEGDANDTINDTLYIADGAYTCGVTLLNGQRVLGDGTTPGTLQSITGIAPVAGSSFPTFSGTRPTMTTTVSADDCLVLGTNNAIRGLNIGNVGVNGNASDISGASFGNLELGQIALGGTGRALNLTTGAFSPAAVIDSIASTQTTGVGGVLVSGVSGDLTVTGATTVDNRGGPGLNLVGLTGTIQLAAVTVNNQNTSATTAIAIDNSTAASSITLASATVNGGGAVAPGIALSGNAGPVTISGGAVTNTAGTDIQVSAGNGNATIAASTTNTAGRSIEVLSRTGGTTTLSGAIDDTGTGINIANNTGGTVNITSATKVVNTGANAAVTLSSNAGTTIAFTNGGLDIDTTSGTGFDATGGGTLTVEGTGNTIASLSATALNVQNTRIGANGLTFLSVSSGNNTAAADPATGIALANTGTAAANGGLTITGTGTVDGSGGTIQSISTRGAEFSTTKAITLSNMNFTNANTTDAAGTCDDLSTTACNAAIYLNTVAGVTLDNINVTGTTSQVGINGNAVAGFALRNSTVTTCGNEVEEGCIKMRGLTGIGEISNSTLSFPGADVVEVVNASGALTMNISSSTFSDSQSSPSGNTGVQLRSQGTSTMVANVTGSQFLRIRTVGLQATAINSASNDVDVTGNTFDTGAGTMIGIDLDADNTGTLVFNVQNNPRIWSRNGPAVNVFGDTNASINGRISNNPDVRVLANVGSNVGSGIRANINKDAVAKLEVINNVVNVGSDDAGIDLSAIGKTTANAIRTLDANVRNNSVTIGATSTYGVIILDATNVGDTNSSCSNVQANAITRLPGSISSFRARVPSVGGVFGMQSFATNAEVTWNNLGNTPASAAGSEVSFGGAGTFNACTVVAPTNPGPN